MDVTWHKVDHDISLRLQVLATRRHLPDQVWIAYKPRTPTCEQDLIHQATEVRLIDPRNPYFRRPWVRSHRYLHVTIPGALSAFKEVLITHWAIYNPPNPPQD